MFSESHNDRRPPIASGITTTMQGSAITLQGSRYGRERDHMLNFILNGDWSNSVPRRQIPEGPNSSQEARVLATQFVANMELLEPA